jgi:hypothetical protein
MVHFHGFFPSANNGRDDNNNRGGPEPQVGIRQPSQRLLTGTGQV